MMTNLSKNFTVAEAMKSATALRLGIDNTPPDKVMKSLIDVAVNILEPVRANWSRPIAPSSWYRCLELNQAILSSDGSQHVKGEAVDFEVSYVPNFELARWCRDHLEFDQLILEFYDPDDPRAGWVHCSYVEKWNRGEVLTWDGSRSIPGLPEGV